MPSTYNYDAEQKIKRQQEAVSQQLTQAAARQAQPAVSQPSASPAVITNSGSVGYTPSDVVLQARQYLDEQIANKPGSYASKYDGELEGIMRQLQNREAFKYDAQADPLYNIYKDLYIQNGRRAMQDTLGNAAALTGGYGSSYAQSAAQQQYNQYMEALNGVVPQLQAQAYQRYADEGDRIVDTFQMMNALENQNYARYRDTVSDWQADRNFALQQALQNWQLDMQSYQFDTSMRENQRQFDADLAYKYYGTDLDEAFRRDQLAENGRQFDADLAYKYYGTDLDEAFRRDQLAENGRQFDLGLAEDRRQYDADLAYKYYGTDLDEAFRRDQLAENIRSTNLDEAYRRDTLAENIRQADLDEAYRQAAFAENIRQYNQNFGETVRQNDLDEAYRRDTLAENIRQADLDEAYRQAQLAESIRQYNQNFGEDVRQNDLDEAYRRDTLAENIRQADLDEAYRQAAFAENIRQYEQNFGEDVRQYDTSLAEKMREFDLAQALDQAQFDFQVRKYEEALAAAGLTGNGGGNDGGSETPERAPVGNITDVIWPQQLDRETGLLNNPMADRDTLDALVSSLPKQNTGNPSALTDRINATRMSNPLAASGASAFVQQAMNNGYNKDDAKDMDAIINAAKAEESDKEKKEKKKKAQLGAAAAERFLTEK